jgi:transposase InsO family protein
MAWRREPQCQASGEGPVAPRLLPVRCNRPVLYMTYGTTRRSRALLLAEAERKPCKTYRTHEEAKADVFDYTDCFYNPKRQHPTIGNLSPVEFEMQAGLA